MVQRDLIKKIIYLFIFLFPFIFFDNVFALTEIGYKTPTYMQYVDSDGVIHQTFLNQNISLPFYGLRSDFDGFGINNTYEYLLQIKTDFILNSNLSINDIVFYSDNTSCTTLALNLNGTHNGHYYSNFSFHCNNNGSNLSLNIPYSSSRKISAAISGTGKIEYFWYRYNPYEDNGDDVINSINSNTDTIVNNQNQNTQDIIDNMAQNNEEIINNLVNNTQDIIDNQNANAQATQDTINNNLNKCDYEEVNVSPEFVSVKIAASSNNTAIYSTTTNNSGGVLDVSNLHGRRLKITFSLPVGLNSRTNYCFAENLANSTDQTCLSFRVSSIVTNQVVLDDVLVPDNANYLYLVGIVGNNSFIDWVHDVNIYSSPNCKNRLDSINDSLTSADVDNGTGSDFFNSFSDTDNGGISTIITKPLVLINSLLNGNSSCSNLPININFNGLASSNVNLPSGCILWDNVDSNISTLYQTFIVGFCSYYLIKRLFNDIQSLKNPDDDRVEVTDL